jgi:hypothetical protein
METAPVIRGLALIVFQFIGTGVSCLRSIRPDFLNRPSPPDRQSLTELDIGRNSRPFIGEKAGALQARLIAALINYDPQRAVLAAGLWSARAARQDGNKGSTICFMSLVF